ncbi:RidA family protein [Micromonospora sonneratiae]|uniref:RidA family protein n=1 Tax=Micromonospora sonneratiae TaxID=1184706 RepID=A0ABW3YP98_9ACTN
MNVSLIDAPLVGEVNYAMAAEVTGPGRLLFISGQIPETADGVVPASFTDQALLAWRNLEQVLTAAGMNLSNLVKVTTFLSARKYRDENRRVREQVLGDHRPALTVIVADIYDERWLLEIEAVAAA